MDKERDYKAFVQELYIQSQSNMPSDLTELQQRFISGKVKKYATMAAEAILNQDNTLYIEHWQFTVQVIAEWTFHKSIDFVRSGISYDYYDSIIQKVSFAAYETINHLLPNMYSREEILAYVEKYVNEYYTEGINELFDKKLINMATKEKALMQCHLNDFYNEKTSSSNSFIVRVISFCFFTYVVVLSAVRSADDLWLIAVFFSIAASLYLFYRTGAITSKLLLGLIGVGMISLQVMVILSVNNQIMLIVSILLLGIVLGIYCSNRLSQ